MSAMVAVVCQGGSMWMWMWMWMCYYIQKVKLVLEIRKNAENCHGSPPSLHALI